jgi:hypothetical protein
MEAPVITQGFMAPNEGMVFNPWTPCDVSGFQDLTGVQAGEIQLETGVFLASFALITGSHLPRNELKFARNVTVNVTPTP